MSQKLSLQLIHFSYEEKTSLLNGISDAKYARHIKIVAAEKYGLEITLTGVLTVLIFSVKLDF